MEKIPSFNIDHNKLLRGIYVSRKDQVGGDTVTTFDIRIKEPNREPVMDNAALHTLEHLGATYLRNDLQWKDKIIYFGPMGCRTGCYLLLKGDLESSEIVELMKNMFRFIVDYKGEIPGAAAKDCGNYLDQNLDMAAWESRKFLSEVLDVIQDSNLIYP
ncbi:S-ribosylhomocysteine lyase [Oceanispirochaeta crateris]|uniref:S-ribosylhomocysteine lyase n=1 Tax=Oceanispirochaeta crateris TaxID=2518645 RepID=A0A5C1QLH5_9SPIO|nr:S-ribosylhomocysteine lyase [Oceanispirochaeta crateris]QEN08069.1 S-ribosylhomocysteine lyase [Oceanispirochaeta crateris]